MKFYVLTSVNISTTYTGVDMQHALLDRILRKGGRLSGIPTYLPNFLLIYLFIKVHNFTKHETEMLFRLRPSELLHHIDSLASGFQRFEGRCDIKLCLHDRDGIFF